MLPRLCSSSCLALALLFAAISAPAAVVEGLRPGDTVPKCVAPDADAVYTYRPGCEETIVRAGHKSEMKYNAQGLRDRDFPAKPRPGWTRVLLVGSSVLAAPGLPVAEMPSQLLEPYLKRELGDHVEVINAGVEGYSASQLSVRLRGWIAAYSPTHVVLDLPMFLATNADILREPFVVEEPGHRRFEMHSLFGSSKAGLTISAFLHRALLTIRCRYLTWSSSSACMMRPAIASVVSMRQEAEAAHAKFLATAAIRPQFTPEAHVSPEYDVEWAQRLDRLTPNMLLDTSQIVAAFERAGAPVVVREPSETKEDKLPGDYHLSTAGSKHYAAILARTIIPFLR